MVLIQNHDFDLYSTEIAVAIFGSTPVDLVDDANIGLFSDADLDSNFWWAFVYSSYFRIGFFVFVILDSILISLNRTKRARIAIF